MAFFVAIIFCVDCFCGNCLRVTLIEKLAKLVFLNFIRVMRDSYSLFKRIKQHLVVCFELTLNKHIQCDGLYF